ncbi:hypothetical protein OIDMADRAFT_48162 [Oidiodendron maius Zn]|uniref:Uncharacterized protein n=1 Tax=Oidiodendron maius (strain Zn) TaxID=913774 RepID=A0A0C3HZL8_OIDMZ|nr:hypothetical protein OIDMADRAFT_48162 [Oidiodendron maius Zn]
MADKRLESESKADLSHKPNNEKVMGGEKDHVFKCKRCSPHIATENASWNHTREQNMDKPLEHRCTTSQIGIVQAVTTTTLRISNNLHDFFSGQIVGRDYKWNDSRKYIFQERKYWGKRKHKGIDDADAKKVMRRVQKGLPYYNDYIWGDQTRKPEAKREAKPAGIVSRDMKPGDSTPTREGMNKGKLSEIVSEDLLGTGEKPITAGISDDCGLPAINGKRRRILHSVPLASKATDSNTSNEDETPVSTEYKKWIKECYMKWMLPHHQDLQWQGYAFGPGADPNAKLEIW